MCFCFVILSDIISIFLSSNPVAFSKFSFEEEEDKLRGAYENWLVIRHFSSFPLWYM